MTHDEITELLGAYALDAVDPDERVAIDDHLVTCARCRAEVEEHREVATLLAHTGGAAPEGVWNRIAESLDATPPDLRLTSAPAHISASLPSRARPRLALALAAAAVVAALVGIQVRLQDQRNDQVHAAIADPLRVAFDAAVDDPASRVFELVSPDEKIVLRGAVTRAGVGYLRTTTLPRLAADQTYQLWGAAGGDLVSLGVLGSDPTIVSFPASWYDGFAITEEHAPGVVASTKAPVVTGNLA
jgi:anti-sigma factor RsiW